MPLPERPLPFAALALALLIVGCDSNPSDTEVNDEVVIREDTYVAEPDELSLTERDENTLSFNFSGQSPDIESGDVIVGRENGGFLREVTGVETEGNTVTLTTDQAALVDAVEQGSFHKTFSLSADALSNNAREQTPSNKAGQRQPPPRSTEGWRVEQLAEGVSITDDGYNLDNTVLYDGGVGQGSLRVEILEGNITFDPDVDVDWDIDPDGLATFHAIASGQLSVSSDIGAVASQDIEFGEAASLATFSNTFIGSIGPVPVVIESQLSLIAGFEVDMEGEVGAQSSFGGDGSVELGARYEDGNWTSVYERDLTAEPFETEWTAAADAEVRGYIRPRVDLTLYRAAGPYLYAEPYLRFNGTAMPPDWDWTLYSGLDARLGFSVDILSFDIADFNRDLANYETQIAADSSDAFNPVEIVALDCPTLLDTGESGTFTATINEGEATPPVTSSWDFGDGTTETGLVEVKSYNSTGNYTVTFTASNEGENGESSSESESCYVEVEE